MKFSRIKFTKDEVESTPLDPIFNVARDGLSQINNYRELTLKMYQGVEGWHNMAGGVRLAITDLLSPHNREKYR